MQRLGESGSSKGLRQNKSSLHRKRMTDAGHAACAILARQGRT